MDPAGPRATPGPPPHTHSTKLPMAARGLQETYRSRLRFSALRTARITLESEEVQTGWVSGPRLRGLVCHPDIPAPLFPIRLRWRPLTQASTGRVQDGNELLGGQSAHQSGHQVLSSPTVELHVAQLCTGHHSPVTGDPGRLPPTKLAWPEVRFTKSRLRNLFILAQLWCPGHTVGALLHPLPSPHHGP